MPPVWRRFSPSAFQGAGRGEGSEAGFTYLTVLFIIAFMGIGLALTGEVWRTAVMREKEKQLLYAGNQYRRAIERYYLSGPRQYPRSLEDLLRDPRKPGVERYLRKLYVDPITGAGEWGIVKAPDGGVMGVYSTSQDKPIKTAGFTVANKDFESAEKYSDWRFYYNPAAGQVAVPGSQTPGQAPGQAGGQLPMQPLVQPQASPMGAPPK